MRSNELIGIKHPAGAWHTLSSPNIDSFPSIGRLVVQGQQSVLSLEKKTGTFVTHRITRRTHVRIKILKKIFKKREFGRKKNKKKIKTFIYLKKKKKELQDGVGKVLRKSQSYPVDDSLRN